MINFETFFKVSYGLYLVSAKYQDTKTGYVANTVFQVTSQPPKFGISCNKDNFSADIIRQSGAFAFSILREKASAGLIGDFGYRSGREIDKFKGVNYFIGETGSPIIQDSCVAWFDCKITDTFDVGSHLIFIGEVLASDLIDPEANSLTYKYYREVMKGFSPKNAPTYVDKTNIHNNRLQVINQNVEPGGHSDESQNTLNGGIAGQARNDVSARKDSSARNENELWQCQLCHFTYESEKGDPISGIEPGTKFEDLPDDWCCPICGADKSMFEKD
jgi:flavin reductase (DIM6/NTAB) family NADH-FMN oxidoreductase RutF/rubredoxin